MSEPPNPRRAGRDYRSIPLFADVTCEQWNDWRWQVKHSIRTVEDLRELIRLSPPEEAGISATREEFAMAIPPYYALLMDPEEPACPIRLQSVPHIAEARKLPSELRDPLGEDSHMVVPGLVHRYPDRALLLVNNMCGLYCRFCTRKRYTGEQNETLPRKDFDAVMSYLRAHREVRDVLISGGDPLTMKDERLDELLAALRAVPHIEILRIGTRMPVVLPQRVTPDLCAVLRKHHPVWVNTHFNHPKELTPEAVAACGRLADAGVPLGNQSVLLRGINSSTRILRDLLHGLLRARVRPYYLYQCDLAEGNEHFRTPLCKGMEIMEQLRGHTTGFAVPTFVVDAPGGGGKLPVGPQYVLSQSETTTKVRNYEFRVFDYPEPRERDTFCGYESLYYDGVPERPERVPEPARAPQQRKRRRLPVVA